ncbi:MAG: hypothetical protein KAI80_02000 [Hyphomicrobiaceae bacterium]|nr:hypothetical protein [Hyphomicrobiaceae bacterium]
MTRKAKKKFDIAGTILHHLESAKMTLLGIPFWVWPMPFLLCVVILLIRQSPIGWMTEKPVQEIIAPTVICLTAVLVLFVHRWVRELFTIMLAVLVWALFMRELHFYGTGRGLYATVIVLAFLASAKRDKLGDFLGQRSIGALLGLSLWTYIISKMFDRHYFSFLPAYHDWNNNVEETLETCGHLFVLSLVVMTLRYASLRSREISGDKKKSA